MNPINISSSAPSSPEGSVKPVGLYRPYYTERNALSCRATFDNLLEHPRNVFIECEPLKLGVSTLQNRLLYALMWLSEQLPDLPQREKYKQLRKVVTTRRVAGGVWIVFKNSPKAPMKPLEISKEASSANWFDQFIEWSKTAKDTDVFESLIQFNGIIDISEEAENGLVRYCAPLGMELEVHRDSGWFRAMK